MTPEDYQRAKQLYHEIETLAPQARKERIDAAGVSDEVREALDKLLELSTEGLFDEDQLGEVGQHLLQETPLALTDVQRIGSYTVLRKLGEGGMGIVYQARRDDSAQVVALKVVRPEMASRNILRRFLRETEVLQRLRHPGIAAFYDAGEATVSTGSGAQTTLPFLAMEYIEGQNLRQYAEHNALNDRQRLVVMARVCEAVHHAHEQGIVHRDLKPQNILVTTAGDDSDSQPKVLDFGLARTAASEAHSMTQTQAGMVMGTLPYMSPEQVSGQLDELDARSDVYSLGVILFELLTGQLPYPVRGRPIPEAAKVIQHEEPSRLGSVVPGLAGDLDHIVAQALEKEIPRRYQSAGELAADLRAATEGRTVMARAPGLGRRLRKWSLRHPRLTGAISVTAVALALLTWLLAQALQARQEADQNAAAAEAARALAQQRGESVLRLSDLKRVRDLEAEAEELWPVHPERADAMSDWLDRAQQLLAKLAQHETVMADLEANQGDFAHSLGDTERNWWREALQILTTELKALPRTVESMQARLQSSRTIEQRTLVEPAELWEESMDYAADPEGPYGGLDLVPQMGLVPLLEDPDSGLLEFWHVESGEEPRRDEATGRLIMAPATGLVFVLVPEQMFLMGSQNTDPDGMVYDPWFRIASGPVHEVTLSPYLLSKYEMSRGQWARAAGNDPSYARETWTSLDGQAYPAESFAWDEAQRTLRRWGLTFPSEAQWECAARAGADSIWWFGGTTEDFQEFGNVGDQTAKQKGAWDSWTFEPWSDGYIGPAPLSSFAPNPFGFFGMVGNVREMCLDVHNAIYYRSSPAVDPLCEEVEYEGAGRMMRDGDYATHAFQTRASARYSILESDHSSSFIGVRPAHPLDD